MLSVKDLGFWELRNLREWELRLGKQRGSRRRRRRREHASLPGCTLPLRALYTLIRVNVNV